MYPLSQQQRLALVESTQLHNAWAEAERLLQSHKYGMKWLKSNGREYLIRLTDAKGNGKSLGPKSPETEAIFQSFITSKLRCENQYSGLNQRILEQARMNKALWLARLPKIVGDILKAINKTKASEDFRMIGTHALFAYESLAGIQFRSELLASGDVDLLYDPRKKLSVVAKNLDSNGLLGLLRKADKSFQPVNNQHFRAINDHGFMVDLIIPSRDMRAAHPVQFAPDDLSAVEGPNLHWLTNAPHVEAVIISGDGMPVRALVPDPRAFAVHKSWLSQQVDREPVKKGRDLEQAKVIFLMLKEYLPNFPIDPTQMRYFPKDILTARIERANIT